MVLLTCRADLQVRLQLPDLLPKVAPWHTRGVRSIAFTAACSRANPLQTHRLPAWIERRYSVAVALPLRRWALLRRTVDSNAPAIRRTRFFTRRDGPRRRDYCP